MTTPYSGQGISLGHLVADVDMASNQYRFVTTASTAGKFKLCVTGSAPVALGVLQDDPRAGEPGQIRVLGSARVAASGTIGFGDFVMSNASGMAVVQATACTPAVGIALTALSSGSGFIEVLLAPVAHVFADNTP